MVNSTIGEGAVVETILNSIATVDKQTAEQMSQSESGKTAAGNGTCIRGPLDRKMAPPKEVGFQVRSHLPRNGIFVGTHPFWENEVAQQRPIG